MIWLLGFYMWLFVHRIFEYFPTLGTLQVERIYMIFVLLCWTVTPKKGWPANRMHFAVLLYGAALLSSWLVSPLSWEPICTLEVENVAKVAVFYFLVVTCVRDENDLKKLLYCFVGAVGLYMAHSLLEYAHGRYEWRMGISRLIGVDTTYGNPNAYAATIVVSLPMVIPLWATRPRPLVRLGLIGFVLGAVTSILLTGSRSGFVGLLAFGMLYVLASHRSKIGILFVGAVAAVAALALPGELQNRFLTLIDSSYGPENALGSANSRLEGLMLGLKLFWTSPLTGTGLGTFMTLTGRDIKAHNLIGQVLSEMGIIGGAAFLGLLFAYYRNAREARRFYRRHPEVPRDLPYYLARSISKSVLLLLLMGWSGHNMFRYHWLWFASFQVVTLLCIRRKAAVLARATRVPRLPYLMASRRSAVLKT